MSLNIKVKAGGYRYSLILLRQLVITDFKLRYQGSALGYLWSLLKPLALFGILYVIFAQFLKVGSEVPNFPVYLLLGVILWSFFGEVTNLGLRSVVERGDLLRKINFPRYILVVSAAASALVNLILNLLVVGVIMLVVHVPVRAIASVVPFLVLELFLIALAVAFFLSTLYVRYRDVAHVWEVLLQAGFYATPIIYPLSRVPAPYNKYLLLNPIAQVVQDARYALITDHAQTVSSLYPHGQWLRVGQIGVVIVAVVLAGVYFQRRARWFAEEV